MSNPLNNQPPGGAGGTVGGASAAAQPSPSYNNQRASPFPFSNNSNQSRNASNPTSSQPLDLNEFPALGQGPFGGQNLTASNLLSSYASQAGVTGSAAASASAIGGGMSSSGGAPGLLRQPPGSFSTDDFPALGAPNGSNPALSARNPPLNNAAPGSGSDPNQNLNSTNSAVGIGSTGHLQEQASAAAALQHQHLAREAHRQSLLGSMSSGLSQNGSSSHSNQLNSNSSQPSNNGASTGLAQNPGTPSQQQQQQQPQQQEMNAARAGFGEPERVSLIGRKVI